MPISIQAAPTATATKVQWEKYTEQPVVDNGGFYLYWCDKATASCNDDSHYSDERRVDLGYVAPDEISGKHTITLLGMVPNALVDVCLRVTAYKNVANTEMPQIESGYSNDACGVIGLTPVMNVEMNP